MEVPDDSVESCSIDLPEYDMRKLMISKDPLCSVDAFAVAIRVVVARLYGVRMCPECPNCHLSSHPCMDEFGSNATPMGGCMGRADALVGAIEAQKAEGVLYRDLHTPTFFEVESGFDVHSFQSSRVNTRSDTNMHTHASKHSTAICLPSACWVCG